MRRVSKLRPSLRPFSVKLGACVTLYVLILWICSSKNAEATLCFQCSRFPTLLDDGCKGLPTGDSDEVSYGEAASPLPPIDDCGDFGVCAKISIIRSGEAISHEHFCQQITDETLRPKGGCYSVPLEDGESINCYCRDDYCNTTSTPHSTSSLLTALTAATLCLLAARSQRVNIPTAA